MNAVIGLSFSAEYLIKGLYENTYGALTEWMAKGRALSSEDRFNREWNERYVRFIRLKPWYEFSFWPLIGELWALPAAEGGSWFRRTERRLSMTGEFIAKTMWAWVIRKGAGAAYGADDERIHAWIEAPADGAWKQIAGLKTLEELGADHHLISLPRYEPFTTALPKLVESAQVKELAGNRELAVTLITPADWSPPPLTGETVAEWPILTEPGRKRVARFLSVHTLHESVPALRKSGAVIDHIFDY